MAFDPEQWLEVAELCCHSRSAVHREAMLRTALNRTYYAVLLSFKHRIEAVLGSGSIPPRGTHQAIYRALEGGGPAFRVSVFLLRELRRQREAADYDLMAPAPTLSQAREAVRQSRRVIHQRIKGLPDAEFRRLRLK